MFELPWPKDLPASCPSCGKRFQPKVNLIVGPGYVSRLLKGFAYGMIVPWMIIAAILAIVLDLPYGGMAGAYAVVGVIFMPPAILAIASIFFPNSRRIICTCGWKKEFRMAPRKSNESAKR